MGEYYTELDGSVDNNGSDITQIIIGMCTDVGADLGIEGLLPQVGITTCLIDISVSEKIPIVVTMFETPLIVGFVIGVTFRRP